MILSLLTGSTPPIPPMPVFPPEPPAIVKELTVEEKIKTNFYKCNTDIEWIRADNAQCKAKTPVATENKPQPIKNASSTGLNGYYAGQCTGYVASRRYVPPGWGNATDWGYNARSQGWTVSATPVAGAIAWRSGHVAYVESVNPDGSVVISEQNYDWNSGIRTITISPNQYQYIY